MVCLFFSKKGWFGMNTKDFEELATILASDPRWGTPVHPGSVYAFRRLVRAFLGYSAEADYAMAGIRLIDRIRDTYWNRHKQWMEGGVHPEGTRARAMADQKRWAEEARLKRWEERILRQVAAAI